MLLTTHYMEEADQLCDRVAIIDHGKILALDTPAASSSRSGPTPWSPSPPTATSTSSPSCCGPASRASTRRTVRATSLQIAVAEAPGIIPAIVTAADDAGFTSPT